MNQYNEFANVYDALMYDVDYEKWVKYINKIFELSNIHPNNILETACGTGQITVRLSKQGYKMIGVDISDSMLSIAESKSRYERQKIKFINQDMSELIINHKFDSILCLCDGINYIIEENKLARYFNIVYEKLNEEGIFIFDISSEYKLKNILGNNTFYHEIDNICYFWDNNFENSSNTIEMDLIIFVPEEKLFKKIEEHHIQKIYKVSKIEALLKKVGFQKINIYDEFSFNKPVENSERIFFAVQK